MEKIISRSYTEHGRNEHERIFKKEAMNGTAEQAEPRTDEHATTAG
jgi:hypothetical protein